MMQIKPALPLLLLAAQCCIQAPAAPGVPSELTMEQLINDASSNTIAAEEKYKGKRFRLTGLVKGVSRVSDTEALVDITDATGAVTIIADLLPSEIKNAAALVRDQIVTVECVGIELRVALDLKNCRVVQATDGLSAAPRPPEWVALAHSTASSGDTDYVDKANIVNQGNHATIWSLRDFGSPMGRNDSVFLSDKSQIEFDCSKPGGQYNEPYFAHFSGHMGTGKLVTELRANDEWTTIGNDPGVLEEQNIACAASGR